MITHKSTFTFLETSELSIDVHSQDFNTVLITNKGATEVRLLSVANYTTSTIEPSEVKGFGGRINVVLGDNFTITNPLGNNISITYEKIEKI